ncbi:MAG: hypothetical protein KY466_17090, partial [Gemmatimonadetes bacterium]|nr:hypothetical protein [Gemmatimonadota bacterium]
MQIRSRVLAIGALGLSAVGFVAVQPREAADVAATAPLLTPLYAPAAEEVESHVVRSGQTLSQVFQEAALGRELATLLLAVREHIDPRRVMPNTAVLVRRWAEDGAPRSVDLTLNADTTVRLRRESVGWYGEMVVTPVEVDTLFLAGRLERGSSLYQSIVGHPELDIPRRDRDRIAYDLADIYGWTLNFISDMRPGDTFRVVYQREARPDGTTRRGRVLAAEIVNAGTPMSAVFFDPRGTGGDYYDTEGRSLRLTFRRYPVQFARIT